MPITSLPKTPTNLPNGFHLAITKLLAKFDAVPLLKSFAIFTENNNATCAAYKLHSNAGYT
jgi:hypothetical protein